MNSLLACGSIASTKLNGQKENSKKSSETTMKTTVGQNRSKSKVSAKISGKQNQRVQPLSLSISSQQIIIAVKRMKKNDRVAFLEDLLAATSPEYLASIREARADYRRGRILSHAEVFGKVT